MVYNSFGSVLRTICAVGGLAALSLQPAFAQSAPEFKGKTININIGYGPGGGYDTYARALAAHLGPHIPGNPSVVPRNMPGAGGLTVANYIYSDAPKDGTQLGAFASSTALEPLMGDPAAKFDPSKFSWIGSMDEDISFCGLWQHPGAYKTFQDVLDHPTSFGSSGGASTSQLHPLLLKNLLHAKIKVIAGYDGTKATNLAMARGEIDGACSLFLSSIMSQFLADVKSGDLKLVVQMGPKTTDVFGKVPSVYDYVKTDEDRQVLDLFFKQLLLARPIVAPPGVPPQRVAILRQAFMDTMRDPAFLADAKRMNIDIDPTTGAEAEKLLSEFVKYPDSVIKKAREVVQQ